MTIESHPARTSLTAEEAEQVRSELERILQSAPFQASKRCHDFLEYIVNRTLDGELDSLTERFLGAELFGRPLDYDTKSDSIVRVRANDVRRRLSECYSELRSRPPVVISLSTGSYVPEFHWPAKERSEADVPSHNSAEGPLQESPCSEVDGSVLAPEGTPAHPEILPPIRPGVSRPIFIAGSIAALLAIAALAVCALTLWLQLRSARQALYPWQSSPALSAFWGSFLGDQRETDLVLADASFSLSQSLSHKSFGLGEYLNRSYVDKLQDEDPKLSAALSTIASWGMGSSDEFEVAQRLLALDPARKNLHLYVARKYQPDLIRRDNVILLGSRYANPWVGLFENQLNFTFSPDNPNEIVNRSPRNGEPHTYEFGTPGSDGYCIIDYLPSPDHNGNALIIQGTSGEPTEAGGDFLLSEEKMAAFQKMLGQARLPYFELLLKTSWVRGTPIASSIVAYRTLPGNS